MERIVLRLKAEEDTCEWVRVSLEGMLTAGPTKTTLLALGDSLKDESVLVLVPGLQITFGTFHLPVKHKRQLILAVPYALEEQLAAPIEDCHFAWKRKGTSDEYRVAVVAHTTLERWLEQLRQISIRPIALVPDFLALPVQEGAWSIAFEGSTCLVRLGESKGFSVDTQNLTTVLLMSLQQTPPSAIGCFGASADQLAELTNLLGMPAQNQPHEGTLLGVLATSLREAPPINLLQGKYKYREPLQKSLVHFKPAFLLLCAVLAAKVLLQTFYFAYYGHQNGVLNTQIEALYQKTFPEDKRIVNPRVQMQSHLQKLRQNDASRGFFDVLGRMTAPITVNAGARLLGLRYNQSRGELDLELEVSDYQIFEKIRQQMEVHFGVEVRSTNVTQDNQVRGSFRLKEK